MLKQRFSAVAALLLTACAVDSPDGTSGTDVDIDLTDVTHDLGVDGADEPLDLGDASAEDAADVREDANGDAAVADALDVRPDTPAADTGDAETGSEPTDAADGGAPEVGQGDTTDVDTHDGDAGDSGSFPDDPALEPSGPDWGPSVEAIRRIDAPGDALAQSSVPSVGPTPMTRDEIDASNRVPLTRLFAVWNPESTVDSVNAVLDEYSLQIGTAHPDLRSLTLITPRFTDREAGRALAAELRATGVFAWVDTTKEIRPYALPTSIIPIENPDATPHIVQTRAIGAWNAGALTRRYARPIRVVVADIFIDNVPDARIPNMSFIGRFLPETGTVSGVYVGNHGYFVANLVASSPTDLHTGSNGALLDPAADVEVQAMSANLFTNADLLKALGDNLPRTGHWVLNASIGYRDQLATGSVSDIERATLAIDWRDLMHTMPNGLVVAAVNNGREDAADRGAQYDSFFNTQALVDDLSTIYPESVRDLFLPGYRADVARSPYRASVQGNTISVGASDGEGAQAIFSSNGHQLLAPGVFISSGCRLPDVPVFPAQSQCGTSLVGVASGTSYATPQVAGAAAWLMAIAPELPVSTVRQILLETARDGGLDVFAATLALEQHGPYPVRAAIADVNRSGAFDALDVAEALGVYRLAAVERPNALQFPSRADFAAYDLNGDGFSRSDTMAPVDVNADGVIAEAHYRLSDAASATPVALDEARVTDLNMLCYLAYSSRFTGEAAARDALVGAACADPFDVVGPHYEGTITYRRSSLDVRGLVEDDDITWDLGNLALGFVVDPGETSSDNSSEWRYRVRCSSAGGGASCVTVALTGSSTSSVTTLTPAYSDHVPPLTTAPCAFGYEWRLEASATADVAPDAIAFVVGRSTFDFAPLSLRFDAYVPGEVSTCSLTGTAVPYDGFDVCGVSGIADCSGVSFARAVSRPALPIVRQSAPPDGMVGLVTLNASLGETLAWELAYFED